MTRRSDRLNARGAFCVSLAIAACLSASHVPGQVEPDGATTGQVRPEFERVVLDADFPGAYQVEIADVDGDGRPDVVAVGGSTCAWYENPGWQKHILTNQNQTRDIITSVTADLDGDGAAEVLIGYDFSMERPTRGKLGLATPGRGAAEGGFQELGAYPSVHRLRVGDLDGDRRLEVVLAPIFGPDCKPPAQTADPARVLVVQPSKSLAPPWPQAVAGSDQVIHAIRVIDFDGDGRADILTAGNSGIALHRLSPDGQWSSRPLVQGAPGTAPYRGSSEIHVGRASDGGRFLATLEPWHGSEVVIYDSGEGPLSFGPRQVIDDSLSDGHALCVADVDGDGTDEVFAGHRGKSPRVSVYWRSGKSWTRTILDQETAAQDLRAGDLNADGVPDIVAVGGATHNVVWYRPMRREGAGAPSPARP